MRSKKAAINILAANIELVIITISSFIVPNLIIHTYGSSVNGLVASIAQFLGYITLIESGIGAIGRASLYKPLAEKNNAVLSGNVRAIESFYRKIAYIFLAYAFVLTIVFPSLVNKEFDWTYTAKLIVILAFATFIQYYFGITNQTLVQADQKKYIPCLLHAFTGLLNLIITILLIKIGASIHIVKMGASLVFIIRPVFLFYYVKNHYAIDEKAEPRYEILKQRWDGLAQHIAFFIHKNTDIVVLTLFANVKEVSVYSVYMLAVSGCAKVVNIFAASLEPTFGNMLARGEKKTLENRVRLCSTITNQLSIVLFSTTAIVLLPFIKLYTRGVTDVNYLRPQFGIIMLVAEAFYCIRLPYQAVVYAAGHFRQTRNGAIIEAGTNIVLSVVLVFHFGLIGVAIGTFFAMAYRTIYYILYYKTKIISESKIYKGITSLVMYCLEIAVILFVSRFLPPVPSNSYFSWILFSCFIGVINLIIVVCLSLVCFWQESMELIDFVRRLIQRK